MIDLDYKYRVVISVVGIIFSVAAGVLAYNDPGLMHHDAINALFGFCITGTAYLVTCVLVMAMLGIFNI